MSEMKSPMAAIGAARILSGGLKRKMTEEGLNPAAVKHGVAIAFIEPDLSALSYELFREESQDAILKTLHGRVPIGLLFGIQDSDKPEVHIGTRPFLNTAQAEGWLSELAPLIPGDVTDPAYL